MKSRSITLSNSIQTFKSIIELEYEEKTIIIFGIYEFIYRKSVF